jgi:CRISPR-associated RAMP protein (TIGR02581 family)
MLDSSPADFHRLGSRLRLAGRLVTRTALHIGAAESGQDIADMPVLKDGRGLPFIQGASLKGVLRSTLESLVRAAGNEANGVWACDSLDEVNACGSHARGERDSVDVDQHCAICRLLGSRVVASHVRISDAMLREHSGSSPIELRDGVAIDRDLALVAGSKKYQFEVVAPGVIFDLEVFVENPRPWLMGLFTLGWDQIADGFSAVGGFSSRGLGRLEIHWEESQQFTAASLLAGQPPVMWDKNGIDRQQQSWREALAKRQGAEHVQD